MHWTIGFVLLMVLIFAIGAWFSKTYPGSIPVIT